MLPEAETRERHNLQISFFLNMNDGTLRANLRRHVDWLSVQIGERHLWNGDSLRRTADYIESELAASGYAPTRQNFTAFQKNVCNVIAEKAGRQEPVVIVGAHYDSAPGSPGADDNASAVAGLLELARLMRYQRSRCSFRFVAFVNEESPSFGSDYMGSMQYVQYLKRSKCRVAFMVCLEMIGYYDGRPCQRYPLPWMRSFYPKTGNFIAVIGNLHSHRVTLSVARKMRRRHGVPVAALIAPLPVGGMDRSDHFAFWRHGYKALMITDTAQYRYDHYHKETDTIDRLDFNVMSQVVAALFGALSQY